MKQFECDCCNKSRRFAEWMVVLAVAITLLFFLSPVHALAPYGSYEQVFQYADGQISVNQTAQLRLADNDPGGLLNVGDYQLSVTSMPPRLVYRAREVGRIPKTVTLHTEEACLVDSPSEADALQAQKSEVFADESTSSSRRLLSLALDSVSYEAAPLYKSVCGQHQYWVWGEMLSNKLMDNPGLLDHFRSAYANMLESPRLSSSRYMRLLRANVDKAGGLFPQGGQIFSGSSTSEQLELLLRAISVNRTLSNDGFPISASGLAKQQADRDLISETLFFCPKNFYAGGCVLTQHLPTFDSYIVYHWPQLTAASESQLLLDSMCFNDRGRCYAYRFADETIEPDASCDESSPTTCNYVATFRSIIWDHHDWTHFSWKGMGIADKMSLYNSKAQCANFMKLAESAPATSNFDAAALAEFASELTEAFSKSVSAQVEVNLATGKWASDVGLALNSTRDALERQSEINSNITNKFAAQDYINSKFQDQFGNVTSLLGLLSDETTQNTARFLGLFNATNARMDELNVATNDLINNKFSLLVGALKTESEQKTAQFQKMYKNTLYVTELLQGVNSQLTQFIQHRQYNRLLTASYYSSADALKDSGSEETPLVSADAIRPTKLTGTGLKSLIDSIVLSYANSTTVTTLSFFADTHRMLNWARPWTTVEQLIGWMGVSPCVIRADTFYQANSTRYDWDSPMFSNITNYCTLWVEASIVRCMSGYNFSNRTCSGATQTTEKIYHTAQEFFSASSINCNELVNASSAVTIESVQLQRKFTIRPLASHCSATFQDKMLLQSLGIVEQSLAILTFVWSSYTATFQSTLRSLELLTYGSLPNGVKTEIKALGYSPSLDSVGLSGGTQRIQCMRGYWLSVHPDTLPVTSLTFDSASSTDSEVFVRIVQSPNCTSSNGSSVCYPVYDSDLRVNYVFQESNSVNIPPSLSVVGDVTSPLFSGLYDVPTALIETTNNPLVRSNLLTYLLMPAYTEKTMEFDEFYLRTVGLFDPYVGSASAEEYKFPVILDNQGYPVCNVAGGLPISATYVAPVDNCIPPFVWSGPNYSPPNNNLYPSSPPARSNTSCPALVAGVLPGISDGTAPAGFTWDPAKPSWTSRTDILFNTLSYGLNTVQLGVNDYSANGKNFQVGQGPPAWSFSAWVTRTGSLDWSTFRCTLIDTTVVTGGTTGFPPLTKRVGISIGQVTQNAFYQFLSRSVVITLDDVIFFVPSEAPIQFELNTPVFIAVVFVTGVQASFNDPSAPYRIQLYVNGVLFGSAIKTSDDGQYNANDGGFNAQISSLGADFQLSGSTAYIGTTALSVENVKFYAWGLSSSQVKQETICGLTTITPRCWLPPPEVIALAFNSSDPNVTTHWHPPAIDQSTPVFALHRNRTACLSSTSGSLISISAEYDRSHSLPPVQLKPAIGFSLTFWMKFVRMDNPIVYASSDSKFYITRNFVLSLFKSTVPTISQAVSILSGSNPPIADCVEYQLPDPSAGTSFDYKFYAISVAGDGSATLFSNGIQVAQTTSTVCGIGATSIYQSLVTRSRALDPATASETQSYRGFWDENSAELMYHYSSTISQQLVSAEMVCELNTYSLSDGSIASISPAKFVLPLAVCTIAPLAVGSRIASGYCRHAAMCGGNCAVYSGVDLNSLIFTPRQVVCDPGWLPPNCVTRCTNLDTDGNCLNQVQDLTIDGGSIAGLQTAYSTNGYWCQILKSFQVSPYALNGQTFVSLSPRTYQYLTDITIPSGKIVTVVTEGFCPSIAMQGNGDGSIWVLFTNAYGTYVEIRIRTTGDSLECINTHTQTLLPYSSATWTVPSLCPTLAVSVELKSGNGYTSCSSFDASTVAEQVANSKTAPVPANFQRTVTFANNEVLSQLATYTRDLAALQFSVMAQAAQASANGIDIAELLQATEDAIKALPPPSVSADFLVNVTDLFVSNPAIAQQLAALQAAGVIAKNAISAQAAGTSDLANMTAEFTRLQLKVSQSVQAQQNSNTALQNQIVASNGIMNQAVLDANAALATFLEALKNAPSGGLNNLSAALKGFLIAGAVCGIISTVVAGYLVFDKIERMNKLRKKTEEEDSDDSDEEEDGEESDSDTEDRQSRTSSNLSSRVIRVQDLSRAKKH